MFGERTMVAPVRSISNPEQTSRPGSIPVQPGRRMLLICRVNPPLRRFAADSLCFFRCALGAPVRRMAPIARGAPAVPAAGA